MDKLLRNKKAIILFIAPAFILFTAVLFYPVCRAIYFSFCNYKVNYPIEFTGFKNYVLLFTKDKTMRVALRNSMFFLIFSCVSQLVMGLLLAALLTNIKFGRNLFKNIYYLPCVLSSAALGLLWMFVFTPKLGINQMMASFGWIIQHETGIHAARLQMRRNGPRAFAAAEAVHAQCQHQITGGKIALVQQRFQRLKQRYQMGAADGHAHGQLMRAFSGGHALRRVQMRGEHQRPAAIPARHFQKHSALGKELLFHALKNGGIALPKHVKRRLCALGRVGGVKAQTAQHIPRAVIVDRGQKFTHSIRLHMWSKQRYCFIRRTVPLVLPRAEHRCGRKQNQMIHPN